MRTTSQISAILKLFADYQREAYQLFPLRIGDKAPAHTGWQHRDYSQFDFASWLAKGGNVGIRLQARDLIIDCDPRNYRPGDDPLDRLSGLIGFDLRCAPTTITGRNGLHLFYRKPKDLQLVGKLDGYDGLDFLSAGKLIVALGSIHPKTGKYYKPAPGSRPICAVKDAPAPLLDLLKRPVAVSCRGEGGELTADQLQRLLAALDPTKYGQGHYPEWIRISAAAHDATGGDPDAMNVWLDWCNSDPDYEHNDAWDRNEVLWSSLKAGKDRGATYRTLFRAVEEAGGGDVVEAIRFELALEEFEELDAETHNPEEEDLGGDWEALAIKLAEPRK